MDTSKHYVKKDEHRIQIALSAPKKTKILKPILKAKEKVKSKRKMKKNIKHKPKKEVKKKKIIKEKIVKKIKKNRDKNVTKPKKKNIKVEKKSPKIKQTSDLFSTVKVKKRQNINVITKKNTKEKYKKVTTKEVPQSKTASQRINDSMKHQKRSDSGEENVYFAKVQSLLEDWPAQSEFAGEMATVLLYIKPSGNFEFKVVSSSNNSDFNMGLNSFLNQLKGIGFGKHTAGRTYEFKVEFIAKE